MRWADLAVASGLRPPAGPPGEREVTLVTADSEQVVPGAVFVAIRGAHHDGHEYVARAFERGAVAAVVESPRPGAAAQLAVADSRAALANLAAAFNQDPSAGIPVVGITGTDGKTTTATMLQSALDRTLGRAGSLTTVDFRSGSQVEPNLTRQTTLEAPEIQSRLRAMVDSGCRAVALEATSHGLAQGRLLGVHFAGAVYTSITHEHLDFHGSWERYFEAKARLLEAARAEDGFAVLNRDDQRAYPLLRPKAGRRALSYSARGDGEADLRAQGVLPSARGVEFRAETPAGTAAVRLPLLGRWNVANALAALGAGLQLGQPLPGLVEGLAAMQAVPGRMEPVELGQAFSVIVDYAHTPAALGLALHELRSATPGRLWVVFGSAGERDLLKRAAMGRIAAQQADLVVVTSEDPRSEDPEASIEAIHAAAAAAGARAGENLFRERDRAEAIRLAISGAQPGDTVLLAGKGHERSILGASGARPWSERGEAEAALRRRLG
ncbi:MAG: UDP-N-acetylmuramoyl-L-alanyl-D-glutamate--2,6-diaminopimelate ligase [Candidatus Dormibacteria bacterium]